MGDRDEIIAAATAHPGASAVFLRDVLRRQGRVSLTVADVEQVLGASRARGGTEAVVAILGAGDRAGAFGSTGATRSVGSAGVGATAQVGLPQLYQWQAEALASWEAQGRRGVVEAVTGTGKTMIGVAAALDELNRGGQVCVLVPTSELLHQWEATLARVVPTGTRLGLLGDGHHDSLGHHDVVVAIVNSAAASAQDRDLRPRRPGGLLVGDECHRYGSERNRLALVEHFTHRLGLSATYARSDDAHRTWLAPFFGPICHSMDFRRAIADGVTARFLVALVGVALSQEELSEYRELTDTMAGTRARLIGRHNVPAEPIGEFLAAVARLARHGDYDDGAVAARMHLAALQDRRRLLAETPVKRAVLRTLAPAIVSSDRAIVFTQSIAAARDAAATISTGGISAAAVHSQLARPERQAALHGFADGRIKVVAAPQVLDEGIDVPAADLAIILASSRSYRQMVQRMGRVLRRKPDGRHARFVIVGAEGTIEDPRLGAHEGFLDAVTDVAEKIRSFSSGTDPAEIVSFLEPQPG